MISAILIFPRAIRCATSPIRTAPAVCELEGPTIRGPIISNTLNSFILLLNKAIQACPQLYDVFILSFGHACIACETSSTPFRGYPTFPSPSGHQGLIWSEFPQHRQQAGKSRFPFPLLTIPHRGKSLPLLNFFFSVRSKSAQALFRVE